MPAIISHHIFGEDAASLLPEGILVGQEDLLAFLLGNQGPDPLWARALTTPANARACHQLASHMHERNMSDVFMSLRTSVSHLREEDKSCGRAFVLGMAAHYVLDSLIHPLVYAQQEELVAANPDLAEAPSELHALIESDLDVWMLMEKRQQTIRDISCAGVLASTSRIDRVAGALISQASWEVFGLEVGAAEYARSVRDYKLFYRSIDPPARILPKLLPRIERLARPHSRIAAQAHRPYAEPDCPFANLDHRVWRSPATGETSTQSFADLFHDALLAWPEFSHRLAQGNQKRLDDMIAGINYYGEVV